MTKRVIVIFPQLEQLDSIERIRSVFDPLAAYVKAHITLVPPFESDISSAQLHAHIQAAVQHIHPFQLKLQGITGHEGEYLFLNVKRGNDQLIELRDKLYTGLLAPHLLHEQTYVPHLTVGRLPDKAAFCDALDSTRKLTATFETEVSETAVYSIQTNGSRPIEFSVAL